MEKLESKKVQFVKPDPKQLQHDNEAKQSQSKEQIGQLVRKATDLTGETPEKFVCPICSLLVFDPQECDSCQNIFCSGCLESWKANKSTCPMCSQELHSRPINRMVKQFLEETMVNCPQQGCEKSPLKYGQLALHLEKDCVQVVIKCQLGCGASFQKKDFNSHMQICPELKCQCTRCEYEVPQSEIEQHDCIRSLKGEIQKLKEKLENLPDQVKKPPEEQKGGEECMKKGHKWKRSSNKAPVIMTSQKKLIRRTFESTFSCQQCPALKIQPEGITTYYCAKGHQLEGNLIRNRCEERDCWYCPTFKPTCREVARCDYCRRHFSEIASVFRDCSVTRQAFFCCTCDFDVCEDCFQDQQYDC